jgi:hypothetical protein
MSRTLGPGGGLDTMAKRKIMPYPESNPGYPTSSLVTILCYPNSLLSIVFCQVILHTSHNFKILISYFTDEKYEKVCTTYFIYSSHSANQV